MVLIVKDKGKCHEAASSRRSLRGFTLAGIANQEIGRRGLPSLLATRRAQTTIGSFNMPACSSFPRCAGVGTSASKTAQNINEWASLALPSN